jgi:hypothetical protein
MLLSEEMREFLRKESDLLDGIAMMLYIELQVGRSGLIHAACLHHAPAQPAA